ncbi:MAG: cysteine desulfurase family protein [Pseudomonadota bacterium]
MYLDHAATTPLSPGARSALAEALDVSGNPSSVHRAGRAARDAIDGVRNALARRLCVGAGQVVFTSGGTEANAIALTQRAAAHRFCSTIEHEAVLDWVPEHNQLAVLPCGTLDLDVAEKILEASQPGLVSVMLVNNVIGTIQPVAALAQLAKRCGHIVHCDAVQAFGKIDIDFSALNVDLLTLSAHKIGGPKGVGALITRDGLALQSYTKGGGQERRRRAGTENTLGIIGFGGALTDLTDRLGAYEPIKALAGEVTRRVGSERVIALEGKRVPHILSLHMPGMQSQLQLMKFDLAGICVSAGSACSSGKVAESHVVKALGLDDGVAGETVRVSFGPETQATDVEAFLDVWEANRARGRSAA